MPLYLFKDPNSEEIKEVFFGMNDEKKYIDKDGVEWQRTYSLPELKTEPSIDPWNNSDFVNKTANMKGTVGDLLDKSSELSEQRADQNGGVDPLKEKYYKNYSKQRGGAKHHTEKKKSFENNDIKIDFN